MPEWSIVHRDHDGVTVGTYRTADEIELEINRNTPSSATYQLARSDTTLKRDAFAPYRTDAFIYRDTDLVISGPHTSRKWDSGEEGVIQVAMQDWMHLLEKLYMPVGVTGDNMSIEGRKISWHQWGNQASPYGISISTIVRELLGFRNAIDDLQWNVTVMPNGGDITTKTFFRAMGLDSKSMLSYITELSGMYLGFDFDCKYVSNNNIDLRLWHTPAIGTRYTGNPKWIFDADSEFIDFSWEDTGPIATRTYGLGQGNGPTSKLADVSIYTPSEDVYRRTEIQDDLGDISDLYQWETDDEDRIVTRLTGEHGAKNRAPQHKLTCSFLTSIFPFNWWTSVHPGDRFRFNYDFGFHEVAADYILTGYNARITAGGDEIITPDFYRLEVQ